MRRAVIAFWPLQTTRRRVCWESSSFIIGSTNIKDVSRFAVNVMCQDQVGLVAKLTRAVVDLDGNIEELYQNVRLGYFIITLMVRVPPDVTAKTACAALEAVAARGDFTVSVLPRQERELPPAVTGSGFILSVDGDDAPGVLTRITAYLADRHINIEDLLVKTTQTRFTITARLTVPEGVDLRSVRLDLTDILGRHHARVSLMHEDIFAVTNRVEMP